MAKEDNAKELCVLLNGLNFSGQQSNLTEESFARPNFNLVCSVLNWTVQIVADDDNYKEEKHLELTNPQLTNESELIEYFQRIDAIFMKHLHLHLNWTFIYKADLEACGELLKVVKLIHQAAKIVVDRTEKGSLRVNDDDEDNTKRLESNNDDEQKLNLILDKVQDGQKLTNTIARVSLDLENLLEEEKQLNCDRQLQDDQVLQLNEIKKCLFASSEKLSSETKKLMESNDELEKELLGLSERLNLKEQEITLAKEKLNDLLSKSSAFSEQYDKLQEEYEATYEAYVSRYK